jgi:hypothetical protein
MALQRPTSLLVFGILHITFGAVWLLGSICGGVFTLSGSGYQKNMANAQLTSAKTTGDKQQIELAEYQVRSIEMQENIPFYQGYQIGSLVFGIVLCVLLIIGGIGLIRVAAWGRTVSLTWAILSILSTLLGAAFSFLVMLPSMNAFFEQEKQNAGPLLKTTISFTQPAMYAAPCFMTVLFIYPALVLYWMLRPSLAEAIRKGGIEVFDGAAPPYPKSDAAIDYDDRHRPARPGPASEGITSDEPPQY